MLNWTDKQNGVDDIFAEDINSIAHEVIKLGENAKKSIVDQTYNPESVNAQSGVAVAEALANVGGGGWKTLIDTTLSAEQAGVSTLYIEVPNGEEEFKKA